MILIVGIGGTRLLKKFSRKMSIFVKLIASIAEAVALLHF